MKKLILLLLLLSFNSFSQTSNHEIVRLSQELLASLSPELRATAVFGYDSTERKTWFYTPVPRKGLDFRKLNKHQKVMAKSILSQSLSQQGYDNAMAIMQLESVLHVLEKRAPENDHRDPEKYYFSFFGTPDLVNQWGWRIEGHHLSLNYTSKDNKIYSETPLFFGTNPARVPAGMAVPEGTEVLKAETNMGFAFLKSLNTDQRKKAIINEVAPADMVTANTAKALFEQNEGIKYTDLNKQQQLDLIKMLSYYVRRTPDGFADEFMRKIENAGFDNLHFVWMGGDEWGKGHYYRIHNPVVLVEYDCTQDKANHVHSVVRDLTNDWGDDVIARHIKAEH